MTGMFVPVLFIFFIFFDKSKLLNSIKVLSLFSICILIINWPLILVGFSSAVELHREGISENIIATNGFFNNFKNFTWYSFF